VTVCGFHWNDSNLNNVIDFSENATLGYIDPWNGQQGMSHLWQSSYGSVLNIDYGAGATITMASSVTIGGMALPEPATLLLFGLGGLLLRRK
jgi:hypothetical protein